MEPIASYDLSVAFLVISDLILRVLRNGLVQRFSNHIYLFIYCIISILIVSHREQFLFDLDSSLLVFNMLECKLYLPDRDIKPSNRTILRKSFILIAPMRQFYFISRANIIFKTKKMFFIEIFE